MAGLREANKQASRSRIIRAAEELIEVHGSTDFTMAELAKTAGVSTFTTYNLIGSKSLVLFTLLNRLLDEVEMPAAATKLGKKQAVEMFLRFGETPVDLYVDKETLYKPLTRYLLGSAEDDERRTYQNRAWNHWRAAVSCLQAACLLPEPIQEIDLVRAANINFTGIIEFWVHGELSNEGLRAQVRAMLALQLLTLNDEMCRRIATSMLVDGRHTIGMPDLATISQGRV